MQIPRKQNKKETELESGEQKTSQRFAIFLKEYVLPAVAILSAIAAVFSAYTASTQVSIQSEAARTSQTGWLTPSKNIRVDLDLEKIKCSGETEYTENGEPVSSMDAEPRVKLSFFLKNQGSMPLTIVLLAFHESISNDMFLWNCVMAGNKEAEKQSELLGKLVGRTVEPNDSILLSQEVSFDKADSTGWTGGQIMVISQSPFNRFTMTYLWIDYYCGLLIKPPPLIPAPPPGKTQMYLGSEWVDAKYRNHNYRVFFDKNEATLSSYTKSSLASIDTAVFLDELRSLTRPRKSTPLRVKYE